MTVFAGLRAAPGDVDAWAAQRLPAGIRGREQGTEAEASRKQAKSCPAALARNLMDTVSECGSLAGHALSAGK